MDRATSDEKPMPHFSDGVSNGGNRLGFMLNSMQYLMEGTAFFLAFAMTEADVKMEKIRIRRTDLRKLAKILSGGQWRSDSHKKLKWRKYP